ncbi:MAG: hypothetical protein HQ565_11900 [Bacteroidetes bacterium]|nr:hypothetical protein [Bacteroidota bacterium]
MAISGEGVGSWKQAGVEERSLEKLNGLHRYMVKIVKAPLGDFWVWDNISTWAEAIVDKINRLTD